MSPRSGTFCSLNSQDPVLGLSLLRALSRGPGRYDCRPDPPVLTQPVGGGVEHVLPAGVAL